MKKAFTLIELLIVVAIIAILAAIAVPNFLEAQTRAKVSKVKGDHRSIATALEAYYVDNNSYPPDQDNDPTSPRHKEAGFSFLTTPVSYMSSRSWKDPFSKELLPGNSNVAGIAPIYQLASGADADRPERSHATGGYENLQAYCIISVGPDQIEDMGNDDWPFFVLGGYWTGVRSLYDPTNGTVSKGDIIRLGGEYQYGEWTIEGISHKKWGI